MRVLVALSLPLVQHVEGLIHLTADLFRASIGDRKVTDRRLHIRMPQPLHQGPDGDTILVVDRRKGPAELVKPKVSTAGSSAAGFTALRSTVSAAHSSSQRYGLEPSQHMAVRLASVLREDPSLVGAVGGPLLESSEQRGWDRNGSLLFIFDRESILPFLRHMKDPSLEINIGPGREHDFPFTHPQAKEEPEENLIFRIGNCK